MKSTVLWALAALNALLAVTFVMQVSKPSAAMAQAGGRPGDYMMIPGEIVGGKGDMAIYVIDASKQQLSVMLLNQQQKLEAMPPMDLNRIFDPRNIGGGGGNRNR